ncbi:VanZ family protein [Paenibacillus sp. BC26]|uniref:VanZ family protein n=1 Tax=Paenibacillus sp. BC26 TaxID=1881032 RepID=UPI0008EB5F9D|nr:VanZ family protein [Paenibacillus sp. BC26]SFT23680.1 Glycopeptide antibiotics resistance protein [Paenibacillus sp. BC26]
MEHEKKNRLTLALFSIYLLVLVWSILLKFHFSLSEVHAGRAINLIPFQDSVTVSGLRSIEIFVNIHVFIPFGIYIGILKFNRPFWAKVLPILGTSLAFEIVQFILAIGRTDITDLFNNTLGGMLGIIVYWVLHKILKSRAAKVVHIISIMAIILVPVFITLYLHITGIRIRL